MSKNTARGALANYGVKSEYLGQFKNLVFILKEMYT